GVLDLHTVAPSLEQMRQRLIGEDVALVTSLGASVAPIRADRGQLEQIIVNLAVNARDAMPGGGKLTIATSNVDLDEAYARQNVGVAPGSYVLLEVRDTGTGMDAETQSRLFEPFFTRSEEHTSELQSPV